MKSEYINYILTVAKSKSISGAAVKLNYPVPKLSRIISSIENEFNTKIFERHSCGVSLTPQGEIFIDKMMEINNILLSLKDELNKSQAPGASLSELTGELHVVAQYAMDDDYRKDIIPEFLQANLNINMSFKECDVNDVIEIVTKQDHTIGIIVRSMPLESDYIFPDGTVFIPVFKRNIVLIAAKDTHLINTSTKTISLKSVVKQPLIILSDRAVHNATTYRLLAKFGTPNIKYYTENIDVFFNILGKGNCLALGCVENETIKNKYRNLITIPIRQDIHFETGLLVKKSELDKPLVKAFIDYFIHRREELNLYSAANEYSGSKISS